MTTVKPSGILKAVQEIDRHKLYLFEHQDDFFRHFDIHDNFKLAEVEFRGAYLDVRYTSLRDEARSVRLSIFDYASWRRHHG